jgi:hypothetical protein
MNKLSVFIIPLFASLSASASSILIKGADLAALESVVNGDKPLLVKTHRASDITTILALAKDFQLQLILSGASEGWMVAEEIAKAGVPVVMDPIHNLPNSYESLGARLDNAKLLADAGVTLLFTGMGGTDVETTQIMGNCQLKMALQLFGNAQEALAGPVEIRQIYANLSYYLVADRFMHAGPQKPAHLPMVIPLPEGQPKTAAGISYLKKA